MCFLPPAFYEAPLVHLPQASRACGVQTEGHRRGLTEGACVSSDGNLGDILGLVLFSAQHRFQHWL